MFWPPYSICQTRLAIQPLHLNFPIDSLIVVNVVTEMSILSPSRALAVLPLEVWLSHVCVPLSCTVLSFRLRFSLLCKVYVHIKSRLLRFRSASVYLESVSRHLEMRR